ncbi:hypothetical protein [Noviherbaspirillum pedocola]|uniref:Uncharacterized protein n=1 Tax=Noviherbaspirillum pedocola TaxID=2801341 RepID=A0A934SZT0_9BURK|nr:hypothetical protein [Noviherbaspirillum pedocola]MBK4736052.1 hypothetical protein [Noviherbaspirillum pedocola]
MQTLHPRFGINQHNKPVDAVMRHPQITCGCIVCTEVELLGNAVSVPKGTRCKVLSRTTFLAEVEIEGQMQCGPVQVPLCAVHNETQMS